MVVARASGTDLASILKRNTFLTLEVRPAGGPESARDGGTRGGPGRGDTGAPGRGDTGGPGTVHNIGGGPPQRGVVPYGYQACIWYMPIGVDGVAGTKKTPVYKGYPPYESTARQGGMLTVEAGCVRRSITVTSCLA